MSSKLYTNNRQSNSIFKRAPVLVSIILCIWSIGLMRKTFTTSKCSSEETGSEIADRRALQVKDVLITEDKIRPKPHPLTMTIFCSPKSYNLKFPEEDEQRRALLSWLRLNPRPKVVLLGNDPTFYEVAKEFPEWVSVEPKIDYNFGGVPQFHSMVARAQAAETHLSMLINGDIILLGDIMPAVDRVAANFDNWVLTAARWDLEAHFPFKFQSPGEKSDPNREAALDAEIKEFVHSNGTLHTYGGVDFWLWNNSPVPLFSGAMPPFTFGRSKYDNWFTHEMIAAGLREVVDASLAVTSAHVAHSYGHVSTVGKQQGSGLPMSESPNFWSSRKKQSWEMFNNVHLAESHGSYTNQLGTALHVPWKLTTCFEPLIGNICLQKRQRPSNCSCEYSASTRSTQTDPKLVNGTWTCGRVSVDKRREFSVQSSGVNGSHSMESVLRARAVEVKVGRGGGVQKVVLLVAVTHSYREMLMNFACRLRLLGLRDMLVVAALDEDLFHFAFTQGLAVFLEKPSEDSPKIAGGGKGEDCAFGSQCFRQFTKLKSRAVLRVLRAGYSVLWSDVDIVWYRDPLPHLMSYGPKALPIQSNEPDPQLPGTGIRRINSGFYFAWANKRTIEAFEAIVDHARQTSLSEQPSFYDVLCGEKGERVVKRRDQCKWKNGLLVVFLDRQVYPNGAVHGLWDKINVTAGCAKCAILHNNWISGREEKKNRLVKNGYWHFDSERRICAFDWHHSLPSLYRPGGRGRGKVRGDKEGGDVL